MKNCWLPVLLAVLLTPLASFAAAKSATPPSPHLTLFVEAEAGAPAYVPPVRTNPPSTVAPVWSAKELTDASGGKVLYYPLRFGAPETPGITIPIPRAGVYRVWVRYFKKSVANTGQWILLRDEAGEELAFSYLDWQPQRIPTEKPYEKANLEKTGLVWESFTATFERPVMAALSFGALGSNERQIDCVLLTTDKQLDPSAIAVAKLPALATAPLTAAVTAPQAPSGFRWSLGLPGKPAFYAGVDDPDKWFWAGLINCGSSFVDGARMVRMGFNRDHTRVDFDKWGIRSMIPVESFSDPAFTKAHPSPEGRFVNAQGQVGSMFSLHYQPWVDAATEQLKQRVKEALATDNDWLGFWRISAEEGGWMDYSSYAVDAFRQWLAARHGAIATLNERWGATYAGFDEIVPAKSFAEGRASWLEFREFCGHAYAVSVGRRIPIIKALDPKGRPCLGANSNLDIAVPYFMAFRPNDFEELIRVGLKDEKYVAFDIYCADDDMASSIDFLTSLAQGRKLINQEFSNHVVDPRIAARTYWSQVAKGVHGIHLFMLQEGPPGHATYPKWALLSHDRAPKQKMAAYSDAAQEVHHIEPLLMASTYTHAVKPVALYWSRIDLGLDQPHDSFYGHSLNSPIHIYRTLRGLGYPVRWITPRQIAEGELAQVGALLMAGCNYIPQAAARQIESWVQTGGTVIADSWPGAFDEYGQPQATLAPIFGVRPAPKKAATGSTLALQESRQGYGEVTDAAVLREKYYEKIDEIAQQPGATHPVALALGDLMVAGVYPETVECYAGTVVGMTHRGHAGFVVNDYGKGKSLYSSFLLGTIYEAAPTRYEWDTTHAGLSYGRVLDAFLKFAGVMPGCRINGLTPRVSAKLRVESPLMTPDGNVLIGLTSMNDDVVKPFDLEVELPAGAGPFTNVLVAVQGSRRLETVNARVEGTTLRLRMPAFDTHATILALQDAEPLVSLELKGVERGPASLAVIQPGQTFEVQAVVHNPSPRTLAAGRLAVTVPAGWLQSAQEIKVPAIRAGGTARCTFRVRAPQLAGPCRINPLVVRHDNGTVKSTPATEMVWWGLPSW